jgi:hypothetical protein
VLSTSVFCRMVSEGLHRLGFAHCLLPHELVIHFAVECEALALLFSCDQCFLKPVALLTLHTDTCHKTDSSYGSKQAQLFYIVRESISDDFVRLEQGASILPGFGVSFGFEP